MCTPRCCRPSRACTPIDGPSSKAASWPGATVHFVTAELDHGPIVAQAAVPVLPGDDEASLSARVLAREHVIYPLAVRWFVEDRLLLADGRVRQRDGVPQWLF